MTHEALILVMAALLSWPMSAYSQNASGRDNSRISTVSLIQVIANPKDFDGQRLRVIGYLGSNGVDKALGVFVSELDGHNFVVSNSIDLHLEDSQGRALAGKYVVLSGTYHAPALRSGYNGYIDQIRELKPWTTGDVPK